MYGATGLGHRVPGTARHVLPAPVSCASGGHALGRVPTGVEGHLDDRHLVGESVGGE